MPRGVKTNQRENAYAVEKTLRTETPSINIRQPLLQVHRRVTKISFEIAQKPPEMVLFLTLVC